MNVTFKFTIDQKVTTPFGEPGIISVLGVDECGITYFVKTSAGGNWFKESQLA